VFGPGQYGLSRWDYRKLCIGNSFVRTLQKGSHYVDAGEICIAAVCSPRRSFVQTPSTLITGAELAQLCILISGKLTVFAPDPSGDANAPMIQCNTITPYEYIDSPEWVSRNSHSKGRFVVTIM